MRWKRSLIALAAAGLSVGLGTSTAAAQPVTAHTSHQYSIYTNTYGIPASVKAGTTFYADAWYMQNSPERLGTTSYDLEIWSYSASTDRGFTVSWLNPVTHRWEASNETWSGGVSLSLGAGNPLGLTMLPHHWYKIQFKVSVGKNVHLGTWHLGAQADGIVGPNGTAAPMLGWANSPARILGVHR